MGTLCLHVTYIHLRSGGIYKINIKKKYYKPVENIEITRKRKKERREITRVSWYLPYFTNKGVYVSITILLFKIEK